MASDGAARQITQRNCKSTGVNRHLITPRSPHRPAAAQSRSWHVVRCPAGACACTMARILPPNPPVRWPVTCRAAWVRRCRRDWSAWPSIRNCCCWTSGLAGRERVTKVGVRPKGSRWRSRMSLRKRSSSPSTPCLRSCLTCSSTADCPWTRWRTASSAAAPGKHGP